WATRADPGQLENSVLNLVINARDAMPHGGTITITTRNVTVRASRGPRDEGIEPGDYAVVEIKDTGTGMSAQVLKLVFDPFFTSKDVGKGSGLGLSTLHGAVTKSGGHVSVTSPLYHGKNARMGILRVHASPARA